MSLQDLINSSTATIVDVRTTGEFMGGHVAGSVNIPLQEIPQRIDELKKMSRPLILCCASGNRSGQATQYLTQLGFENVYNGGGWMAVNFAKSQA